MSYNYSLWLLFKAPPWLITHLPLREEDIVRPHFYVESKNKQAKVIDIENRLMVAKTRDRGWKVGKMCKDGQKVQNF